MDHFILFDGEFHDLTDHSEDSSKQIESPHDTLSQNHKRYCKESYSNLNYSLESQNRDVTIISSVQDIESELQSVISSLNVLIDDYHSTCTNSIHKISSISNESSSSESLTSFSSVKTSFDEVQSSGSETSQLDSVDLKSRESFDDNESQPNKIRRISVEKVHDLSFDDLCDLSYDNEQFNLRTINSQYSKCITPMYTSLQYKDAKLFILGIRSSLHSNNIGLLNDVICKNMRPDAVFRKFADTNALINKKGLTINYGRDKVTGFYKVLLNTYSDGIMSVKSVTEGIENKLRVIRSKVRFSGTTVITKPTMDIFDHTKVSTSVETYQVFVKAYIKTYLDESNQIIVYDQAQYISLLPMPQNDPLSDANVFEFHRKQV